MSEFILVGVDLYDGHTWLTVDDGETEHQFAITVDYGGEETTIYPPDASPASMWALFNKDVVLRAIERAECAVSIGGLKVWRPAKAKAAAAQVRKAG